MNFEENFPLPNRIGEMNLDELELLSKTLRKFIIDIVLDNGGHFAANLGVIELTVALLNNFNPLINPIIWDVGHQSYPFKVLTGRAAHLKDIRKTNGISGFPKIEENKFDAFGTGHSSTAISAAMGMASAHKLEKNSNPVIAIVGDGAFTGGMNYEALNNLKDSNLNILIVLNDNQIGIDPNTGALNYNLKNNNIKNWIQWFGVEYSGPIDGHNLNELINEFGKLKKQEGPRLIHVKTIKGKGHKEAEKSQTYWHSAPQFVKIPNSVFKSSWSSIFGNQVFQFAQSNPNLFGITPAMPSGSGLVNTLAKFPERFFDVGISEQHAMTFAAGIAAKRKPVIVSIYSTFLQRGYDQLIHDVAIQKLPVTIAIDRAGLVGEDGPTHHGVFDISYLLPIPNITILAPYNAQELWNCLSFSINSATTCAIRYPRGTCIDATWEENNYPVKVINHLKKGSSNILLLTTGKTTELAKMMTEYESLNFTHIHLLQIKPIPQGLDLSAYSTIITVEDGSIIGGMGHYLRSCTKEITSIEWIHLGIPDYFIPHGSTSDLYKKCGFDTESIQDQLIKCLN